MAGMWDKKTPGSRSYNPGCVAGKGNHAKSRDTQVLTQGPDHMQDLDILRATLGDKAKRIQQIGGQVLIQGDCLEVMPLLGRVDAVVTDPPYGIGYKMPQGGKSPRNTKAIIGDDKPFDPSPFFHMPCLIFGADHFSERLPSGTFHVWDKNPNGAVSDNFSDAELFWTSWGGARRVFRHLWKGMCQASENGGKQRWHPTQKPIALMEWCLGFLPNATTILDPFMGSGTTLVACQNLDRNGIGIELDPDYFEIACKRVDEATRQPRLFAEPTPKPTQDAMDL